MFLLKGGVQLMAEGGEKVLSGCAPSSSSSTAQRNAAGAARGFDLELEEQRRCALLVAQPTLERLQLVPRTAVRGLPFSANAREVHNVFAPFSASGTLLSVQLFESAGCARAASRCAGRPAFADARDAQQAERDDVSITMMGPNRRRRHVYTTHRRRQRERVQRERG